MGKESGVWLVGGCSGSLLERSMVDGPGGPGWVEA